MFLLLLFMCRFYTHKSRDREKEREWLSSPNGERGTMPWSPKFQFKKCEINNQIEKNKKKNRLERRDKKKTIHSTKRKKEIIQAITRRAVLYLQPVFSTWFYISTGAVAKLLDDIVANVVIVTIVFSLVLMT